ncbi:MAG TPA: serine/threonine-protein kinase, partial [Candidatus Obscuribacterales bacterium]
VAIKTLNFQVQDRPAVRERFSIEIQTLAKLEHPNIVTVHDCIYGENHQPYLIMDLIKGRSLDDILRHENVLSFERVRKIGIQVCAAVKHAHNVGVVHRDIKPGNIMLLDDEQDFVKVVDFGLAKLGEESRRLTQTGEFWGSPPYVSPEQVKGERCDARSDIYSLGCVLYELLTGKDPFNGAPLFQLMRKHVLENPPTFKEANPDVAVPPELEAIIFKAMAKDPAQRFQSMTEFQAALEKMHTGPTAVPTGTSSLVVPARPAPRAALAKMGPDVCPHGASLLRPAVGTISIILIVGAAFVMGHHKGVSSKRAQGGFSEMKRSFKAESNARDAQKIPGSAKSMRAAVYKAESNIRSPQTSHSAGEKAQANDGSGAAPERKAPANEQSGVASQRMAPANDGSGAAPERKAPASYAAANQVSDGGPAALRDWRQAFRMAAGRKRTERATATAKSMPLQGRKTALNRGDSVSSAESSGLRALPNLSSRWSKLRSRRSAAAQADSAN